MFNTRNAFTLSEIMITVLLIAIIAGFGIPSYRNMIEKSDEKEAQFNLEVMAAAMDQYQVRNAGYPPANLPQITDINTTLNLGIIEQNVDFACTSNAGTFTCTGVRPAPNGWTLSVSDTSLGVVTCAVGPCPTL